VLSRWPRQTPLAELWSGGGGPHARWTVLALPQPAPTAEMCPSAGGSGPLASPDAPPFQGGWIGCLEYELGAVLEPAAGRGAATSNSLRSGSFTSWVRCDDALIFDHVRSRWWAVGAPPELEAPRTASFELGPIYQTTSREQYQHGVAKALEYIRAGDMYQVNLAHHLRTSFRGDPRAFFAKLASVATPWYGAYLELPGKTICSASPELFLSLDPHSRTLTTRPMKGTRPAAAATGFESSPKERAELTMITDLMRNDLGRACELGSVRVTHEREIERHAQLLQATATISGPLRQGLTIQDALRATFPGGSVTGAPKIRAMQIISELEQTPRGPYCGAIGFVSRSGHASFNVAIRTATIADGPGGGILDYAVGAGIVADSDPAAEWQETLDKAGVLRACKE
jgi:para-aminobenzoate synthetase component 1